MKNIKLLTVILSVFVTCCFAGDVKEIGSAGEFDDILASGNPVVADFFATWCPPCKMLAPVMEELSADYEGKVVFVKIDVDKQGELAKKFMIRSIPDIRIFKNGQQVKKIVGYKPKKELDKIIKSVL